MPRPDHELTYVTNILDVPFVPGERIAVIALVEVRSDKQYLDADDAEHHLYGGTVRYAAHVLQTLDGDLYDELVKRAHAIGTGGPYQPSLDEAATPTPERTDAELDGLTLEPPVAMAPVDLGDGRPAQDVKLEHLASVGLTTGEFYSAIRMLKLGRTLADVTEGWPDGQRAYVASFLADPAKPKRTRKPRTA